jgi:predicted ATPase
MTSKSFDLNLPGYRVIQELDRNPKTIVYRALVDGLDWGAVDRTVIIKLLSSTYSTSQELVDFFHQYTISKGLDLSGVVRIYDLEEVAGSYALIMEDFGGISLARHIQAHFLPLPDVLHIMIQLVDTLQALGQRRILHKDIKPSNILINPHTKQVKLIDFGIASLLPRETPEILHPQGLEGTLAYISPEQTGRMNRGIDYRTDFYALGVSLYELLTGKLPFESADPLELIYCHLAQTAVPAHLVNPDVPVVVSQIVAKLMAKNAEDRYQSALGLKFDIEKCLQQWQEIGVVEEWPIGQRDLGDRFIIPDKLYGRTTEVEALFSAFNRVSQGQTELILIAGSSGIGKTAVINEIRKPIVKQHGYFIKGKYDQFNRNIPFSALIQSFRDLIGQLFSESDTQLADYKNKILTAVGKNGRMLLEVIPELERIIGSQPPVVELVGMAAQQQFNLVFQKFVGVFATSAHPLTIFLDDLQWVDSASLRLIKLLLADTRYLLLLGAYRDNEVSSLHPLKLTLQELQKSTTIIKTITLAPLAFEDTNRLVADTLHCDLEIAKPLTRLIDLKTKGNPFFTTQFLKALHADQQITFNPDGYWECDLVHVQSLAITDDVVAFMAEQLQKLPSKTQQVIKLAACIGDRFDIDTLAIIAEQPRLNTATALWEGLQAGLILPTSQIYKFFQPSYTDTLTQSSNFPVPISKSSLQGNLNFSELPPLNSSYRFLHDRVQQAAYSLIPLGKQQQTHLQIGRLLLANTSEKRQPERLFEIVNHFNTARNLFRQPAEREMLAQLNFKAAQKARSSTAYHTAFNYAQIGISLLGELGWKQQYRLTLCLYETLAEAAFLNGDFEIVPKLVEEVLDRVQTPLDRFKTYETIIQFHILQKQYQQAIDRGLEIICQLGVELSPQPSKLNLVIELAKTKLALRGKSTEQLIALPAIATPEKRSLLRILALSIIPAFLSSPDLMVMLVMKGIQLTLRYGNTSYAASFYAAYAAILANIGDLQQSYESGQLALILVDRFDNLEIAAKVKATMPWFSILWRQPLRAGIPIIEESITTAMESGNLTSLGLGASISVVMMFYSGISLHEITDKLPELEQSIIRSKDEFSHQLFKIGSRVLDNLRETSAHPSILADVAADEIALIAQLKDRGEIIALNIIYTGKKILAYIFEDIPVALNAVNAQLPYESANTGITQGNIFDALTRLAAYPESSDQIKTQLLKQVVATQSKLAKSAKLMPGNFQHKYDLVSAEKCRVLGDFNTAMELYDRAITGAKKYKYLHEEAIANECAAKFYYARGQSQIAASYMQSAYYCYTLWGSKAKTNDLERRYPEWLRMGN